MSILTDFASAAFQGARSVIGGETISIQGGTSLSAVLNEAASSRDYETGGFDAEETLRATVLTSEFAAAYTSASSAYLGKTCTARGKTYRVREISRGQNTTDIDLIATTDT